MCMEVVGQKLVLFFEVIVCSFVFSMVYLFVGPENQEKFETFFKNNFESVKSHYHLFLKVDGEGGPLSSPMYHHFRKNGMVLKDLFFQFLSFTSSQPFLPVSLDNFARAKLQKAFFDCRNFQLQPPPPS